MMPMSKASWLVAAPFLLLASGYAADWQIQVVDAGGGGKYASMRVDTFGNAHAAYYNEQLHEMKYGFWDHRLNRWFTMMLDDRCIGFTSLALDSQQHPHIAYLEYGTGRLKYAHFDGKTWTVAPIPLAVKSIEYYTSILLDSKDRPIISYYEILNPNNPDYILHLRAVRFNGQYWELSTVDGETGSGKFNSMAMGRGDIPQVAYANVRAESSGLRYARWNGASWDFKILSGGVGAAQPAYSVNLALGKDDIPHITYTDPVNRTIKYATFRDNKWRFETVDAIAGEAFPDKNGIALDESGVPYMSYFDLGAGILKLAHREARGWASEVVEKTFSGFTPSLSIVNGEILILYYDTVTNSLKFARRAAAPANTAPANAGDLHPTAAAKPNAGAPEKK